MVTRLLVNLYGVLTVLLLFANVVVTFVPVLLLAVVKLLTPVASWRDAISRGLTWFGEHWITGNRMILAVTQSIDWDVRGLKGLERRGSYLMVANHQSWVDILVLQLVFNRRVPFLKFFIKDALKWVPFLGLAWWAMDMPFMKRYSREFLARHPEKRGKDLETTRRACRKFRRIPTTVINFVEGTRVSPDKQRARDSDYVNLMPPRAGGVAFVIGAMGDALHSLLDVTIVYPDQRSSFWDLCCGRLRRVIVDVRVGDIDDWILAGDYQADDAFRASFQAWLSALWHEKDARIGEILAEAGRPQAGVRQNPG